MYAAQALIQQETAQMPEAQNHKTPNVDPLNERKRFPRRL